MRSSDAWSGIRRTTRPLVRELHGSGEWGAGVSDVASRRSSPLRSFSGAARSGGHRRVGGCASAPGPRPHGSNGFVPPQHGPPQHCHSSLRARPSPALPAKRWHHDTARRKRTPIACPDNHILAQQRTGLLTFIRVCCRFRPRVQGASGRRCARCRGLGQVARLFGRGEKFERPIASRETLCRP